MCAQIYFWDTILYLVAIPLTKISILLFYLRIFPQRAIRIICFIFIGLNITYMLVFEAISIFQCTPVEGAWKAWDGTVKATCRDVTAQGWGAAIGTIALDVATLVIPLPPLYKLSMSFKRKAQVMLMFSLGFL